MGRMLRSCLQSMLKLVNSVIGLAGMGMILYSLWMIRVWYKQTGGLVSAPPWFVYTFLGLGIFLCLITCSGHIAAETASSHCLSCVSFSKGLIQSRVIPFLSPVDDAFQYMVFVFLLVMLEAAITADIFLNRNWEEDFPQDPTGKFDELKDFVRSNFEMCKWIGLSVVAAQALSIFLAMVLRTLGPDRGTCYDSDDDIAPARLPLLRNQVPHTSYTGEPNLSNIGSWNVRIHEKVSR